MTQAEGMGATGYWERAGAVSPAGCWLGWLANWTGRSIDLMTGDRQNDGQVRRGWARLGPGGCSHDCNGICCVLISCSLSRSQGRQERWNDVAVTIPPPGDLGQEYRVGRWPCRIRAAQGQVRTRIQTQVHRSGVVVDLWVRALRGRAWACDRFAWLRSKKELREEKKNKTSRTWGDDVVWAVGSVINGKERARCPPPFWLLPFCPRLARPVALSSNQASYRPPSFSSCAFLSCHSREIEMGPGH